MNEQRIEGYRFLAYVNPFGKVGSMEIMEKPYTDEEIAAKYAEFQGVPVDDVLVTDSKTLPPFRAVYIRSSVQVQV